MDDQEALDQISAILSAPLGSGRADLDAIAQLVKQTGRTIGKQFSNELIRLDPT